MPERRAAAPRTCTEESEMKTSLLSTLALALGVSALPLAADTSAQDLYISAFQGGIPLNQNHYTGQTSSNVQFTYNLVTAGPQRLTNIEARHDASGNLVYDTSYNFGSGSHALFMDIPEAVLDFHQGAQMASGRHLTHLTSYLDADGTRLYTAVFGQASGLQVLEMGLDLPTFEVLVPDYAAPPLSLVPSVVEVYRDAEGVRRHDVAFSPTTGGNWVSLSMTESQFLSKNATQEGLGRRLLFMETWRSEAGNRRYMARWSAATPPFPPVFFLGEDESTFLSTVQAQQAQGKVLISLAVLEDIVPADWSNYGTGLAGTNGVPSLTLSDDPFLGRNLDVEVGSSAPASSLCGLFLGLTQAAIPFKGGELLLAPFIDPLLFPLPSTGLDLPTTMPADPILDGVELFVQSAISDSGAIKNVSLSRGLKMTLGAQD
jgi:hypothetical protein